MKMPTAFALLALAAFSLAKNLTPNAGSGANGADTAVAKVPCANVLRAIKDLKNGDAKDLWKCLCDGNVWGAGMSGSDASYHLGNTSFQVKSIDMNDHVSEIYQNNVYYDVRCEFSEAYCETAPASVCDVVRSEDNEDRRALSFEEEFDRAFDGAPPLAAPRPRRMLGKACARSSG